MHLSQRADDGVSFAVGHWGHKTLYCCFESMCVIQRPSFTKEPSLREDLQLGGDADGDASKFTWSSCCAVQCCAVPGDLSATKCHSYIPFVACFPASYVTHYPNQRLMEIKRSPLGPCQCYLCCTGLLCCNFPDVAKVTNPNAIPQTVFYLFFSSYTQSVTISCRVSTIILFFFFVSLLYKYQGTWAEGSLT